jgi:hypothetical protein
VGRSEGFYFVGEEASDGDLEAGPGMNIFVRQIHRHCGLVLLDFASKRSDCSVVVRDYECQNLNSFRRPLLFVQVSWRSTEIRSSRKQYLSVSVDPLIHAQMSYGPTGCVLVGFQGHLLTRSCSGTSLYGGGSSTRASSCEYQSSSPVPGGFVSLSRLSPEVSMPA